MTDQQHGVSRCPEQIHLWLSEAVRSGASDLHLVGGYPPMMRVHGQLTPVADGVSEDAALRELLTPLIPAQVNDSFVSEKNIDFSLELPIEGSQHRFRVNYFRSTPAAGRSLAGSPDEDAREIGACFRVIPSTIPDFEWAGFPRQLADRLAGFRNGLVLLSGVTGSGKTTTLAMIINLLSRQGSYRIVTVEDPVEYLYGATSNSVITQREVGIDVNSFADGLKYGLRQDPDVLLVGEIRDHETAQMALSAAETGHLVFSTLHTRDAKGAILRYADLFPQSVQGDIRSQLSLSLRAVISQHLLQSAEAGRKRELALEVLFNNAPIASAIRSGKFNSIDNNILTGRADGMITLDDSILDLFHTGRISRETAERFISDPSRLGGS